MKPCRSQAPFSNHESVSPSGVWPWGQHCLKGRRLGLWYKQLNCDNFSYSIKDADCTLHPISYITTPSKTNYQLRSGYNSVDMTEWACSVAVQLPPVFGSTWKRLDPYSSSKFLPYSPGSVILFLHTVIASQAWIFLCFVCRFVVIWVQGCGVVRPTRQRLICGLLFPKKTNPATLSQRPQDVIDYLCVTYVTNRGSVLLSVPVCCCAPCQDLEIESAKWNFRQNSFYHLDLCLFFFSSVTWGGGGILSDISWLWFPLKAQHAHTGAFTYRGWFDFCFKLKVNRATQESIWCHLTFSHCRHFERPEEEKKKHTGLSPEKSSNQAKYVV